MTDEDHGQQDSIIALRWLDRLQTWASISRDGFMRFSDPALEPTDFGVLSDEDQHDQGLEHAWVGGDGRCVLVLRDTLQCFQICDDGLCEERGQPHPLDATATRLTVNRRGDWVALALGDRLDVLALSDVGASPLHELRGHARPIRGAWIDLEGTWLASISEDGMLCLWSLPDSEPLLRVRIPLLPDQDARLRLELDGAWQSPEVLWLAVRVAAQKVYVIRLDARSATGNQASRADP